MMVWALERNLLPGVTDPALFSCGCEGMSNVAGSTQPLVCLGENQPQKPTLEAEISGVQAAASVLPLNIQDLITLLILSSPPPASWAPWCKTLGLYLLPKVHPEQAVWPGSSVFPVSLLETL